MYLFPLKEVLTLARPVNAGQDFDQRGFARAVITEQAHHLPGIHFHRNVFQRNHAAEVF